MVQPLFSPREPDYTPVQGKVVMVGKLESGRPVLTVELDNKHRVRAILNNDDIRSGSIPFVGALVECIQENSLWIYVRTLTVLQGHSEVGVDGAGWGVSMNRAQIYSTIDRFLGMNDMQQALHAAMTQIVASPDNIEVNGPNAGIKLDTQIRLTGGQGHNIPGTIYQPVVALPSIDFIVESENNDPADTAGPRGLPHVHDMTHTHMVDYSMEFKLARMVEFHETIVDTPDPVSALSPPTALSVSDIEDAQQRTFFWQAYPQAIWYNLRGRYGAVSDPAGIMAVKGGSLPSEWGHNLIAAMVPASNLFLRINTPLLGTFSDTDRGIGRLQFPEPSAVNTPGRTTQIEVIEFQVQAQVDNPKRVTEWSEPKYLVYADYEIPA